MEESNKKNPVELATILQEGIGAYVNHHGLSHIQEKAVKDIVSCRTSELGGHRKACDSCGFVQQAYNSCRNRHCPKCQFVKQEQWVDRLANNLLPCKYYHVVFTIPSELHALFYQNQEKCYDMLFKSATGSLLRAAGNPEFLGAQAGALAVLHTWTQTLSYHPHIHMLVPAGGLSHDGVEWISAGRKFFLPKLVISRIFRGILVRLLKEALEKGALNLSVAFSGFDQLKEQVYRKDWNVYIKKSFGGINSVLKYLGRYTHRVAISNSRLVSFEGSHVSFRYKDNNDKGKRKVMTLETGEFIRRFLQHILPGNFYKIRYVGILASANTKTKKEQCISLIGVQVYLPELEGLNALEVIGITSGKDPLACPKCHKGRMCLMPCEAG
jgi:hypothetical protein